MFSFSDLPHVEFSFLSSNIWVAAIGVDTAEDEPLDVGSSGFCTSALDVHMSRPLSGNFFFGARIEAISKNEKI